MPYGLCGHYTPLPAYSLVYPALPPPPSPPQRLLILPQPSASVSSLTCILRKPLLTCLPTNNIQGDKGIKEREWLLLQSQLTLCDMFSQKTEGLPVARIQKSDLSSQAAAACLDLRPRARWIPCFFFFFFFFFKWNGCLSLDPRVIRKSTLRQGKERRLVDWKKC